MLAVRVPPSACSTSQSTTTWRSPSTVMSHAARRLRPIRRWISTVRPLCLPLGRLAIDALGRRARAASSTRRSPSPCPCRASTAARRRRRSPCTARACVPNETRHEPAAISVKSRSKLIGSQLVGGASVGSCHGRASLLEVRRSARAQVLGVVELGPEQAGAELAERVDVAARQEAMLARRVSSVAEQPELARASRRAANAVSSAELTSVTAGPIDVADRRGRGTGSACSRAAGRRPRRRRSAPAAARPAPSPRRRSSGHARRTRRSPDRRRDVS